MGLRKGNDYKKRTDYKHLVRNTNVAGPNSYTHDQNLPTNFELKSITLEDIDMGIFQEFNKRFIVQDKQMPLISGDADVTSIFKQNWEQFDKEKQFLNGPFFVFTRKETKKMFRTNPSYKPVVYVIPKSKAQGIVYEEYITEAPVAYELVYNFIFISGRRDSINQMEQQLNHYFRNKRNIVVINNERFSIGPTNAASVTELEINSRDDDAERTSYKLSMDLKLWCFTRDLSNMKKRERPNRFVVDISVKDNNGDEVENNSQSINIERVETDNVDYPEHP